MNSPHDSEDGDVAESEIRDWIYILIDLFGIEDVGDFTVRAMGDPMYERDAMILAYGGEVLRDHVVVTKRVTAWRNSIPVVQSHGPPVHPFDSEQRSLAIPDGTLYILADSPDNAPTLDASEYEQWLQMAVSKQQRRHDKEASKERDLRWHQMRQDPHREPEDWVDLQRRNRDNKAQHHRARSDEHTNNVYNHTSPVGPSGLTATMPGLPYPPLQPGPRQEPQQYETASPTLPYPTGRYMSWFGPRS
ncbi:hypothetical protein EDD18DRAFT_1359920 [Armillaria luteobubalina]|uniref:Uncharacterized protein n=1 Tax=Armillaria luteobubalina TaxID=153913 RepID=A0AA39PBG1_9AGAR|nr:hypothetical protein EDD18DRAFT_1363261 [Armillaria luteobubalina]KAK0488224.1 hypothetical protein EDD18DRAFT_1359920 [Armillaria luteobubalina]